MSALSDAQTAYLTNSGYDVNNSVDEAKLFLVACRQLIMLLPRASADERTSLSLSPDLLQKQLAQASDWLTARGSLEDPMNQGVGETALDFSNYRGGGTY